MPAWAQPAGMGNAPPMQPGSIRLPHRAGLVGGLGIGSLVGILLANCGSTVLPFVGCLGLPALGCGIAAWVMANGDLAKMRSGLMDPSGLSMTKTGKVCGIITVALTIIGILVVVIAVALGISILGAAAAGAAAGGGAGGP